jgi:queuine tRNA-ribosyltransferase
MLETVKWMDEFLPNDKPRYLMGVGTPADLVESVSRGVDLFDCVMPTRNARNGQLFTFDEKINIRNAKYKSDFSPIDENKVSSMSETYTKAYLHHLFKTEEILGYRIATQHNLYFYILLMKTIREEIQKETFESWSNNFLTRYNRES